MTSTNKNFHPCKQAILLEIELLLILCFHAGLDMIKVLRRSMRIGRSSRKVEKVEEEQENDTSTITTIASSTKPSFHARQKSLDFGATEPREYMNFGSCSSIIHEDFSSASPVRNSSSGFEALRISFSKRRAQGRATSTLTPPTLKLCVENENERSDMFLLDSNEDSEDAVVPGWPLMSNTIGFETKKIKKQGFRGHHPSPSVQQEYSRQTDSEMTTNSVRDRSLSLAQEVACRCSNKACIAFPFEDLEAATQQFSQGKHTFSSRVCFFHAVSVCGFVSLTVVAFRLQRMWWVEEVGAKCFEE